MKKSIKSIKVFNIKTLRVFIFSFLIIFFFGFGYAQQVDQIEYNKEKIIMEVCKKIETIYPDGKLGKKVSDHILEEFKLKKYEGLKSPESFADKLASDLVRFSKDVHFNIKYDPELAEKMRIDAENVSTAADRSWTENQVKKNRPNNFGFKELRILEGNIGYLKLDVFFSPKYAGDIAVASMNFFSNCDGLIIDLRNNKGGWDEMGMFLLSYFMDEDESQTMGVSHSTLSDIYHTSVTYNYVPGHKHLDIPVYILVSKKSASSAEGFAYRMKYLKRAILIGEKTAGAETPIEPIPVGDYFILQIPCYENIYSSIEGPGWQGIGVEPDIEVDEDAAIYIAHKEFMKSKLKNSVKEKVLNQWIIDGINTKLIALSYEDKDLNKFTGQYGKRRMYIKDESLYYQNDDGPEFELIQMTKTLFQFKLTNTMRIMFFLDANQNIEGFSVQYSDGYKTKKYTK